LISLAVRAVNSRAHAGAGVLPRNSSGKVVRAELRALFKD